MKMFPESKISTISEPSLKDILRIRQHAFGYMQPDSDILYLETLNICPCVGVYASDSRTGLQTLAHLDKDPEYPIENQLLDFLSYFRLTGLTEGFDEFKVLKSLESDRNSLKAIHRVLESLGCDKPEDVNGKYVIDVIIDRKGIFHWVDPLTLQTKRSQKIPYAENKACGSNKHSWKAGRRNDLKCENTGEFVGNGTLPVFRF